MRVAARLAFDFRSAQSVIVSPFTRLNNQDTSSEKGKARRLINNILVDPSNARIVPFGAEWNRIAG